MELIGAARDGDLEKVNRLIDAGVDIHAENNKAFRYAAYNNRLAIVNRLIEANAKDNEAFRYAVEKGDLDIVESLIKANVNIHSEDELPLRCAALKGHSEIVRCLIEKRPDGANIHVKNNSALRLASNYGRLDTVKVLLDAGAIYNPRWLDIPPHIRQFIENYETLGPKSAAKLT